MNVLAMGFVNKAVMLNENEQSRDGQGRGFANLLSGLAQPQNSSLHLEKIESENTNQLLNEELTKLISFLNVNDLTETEFGSDWLDHLLSDVETNMTDLIKDHLQLSDENIVSAITTFLKDINFDTEKVNANLSMEELIITIEELPQMKAHEALAAFVHILPFINMDQITLTKEQNFADLMKSVKLLELLSQYETPHMDQQNIKVFLQKANEKFEVLLKETALSGRSEFLNRVFNPVVKELSERRLINHQIRPSVSMEQPFNEMMSEKTLKVQNDKLFPLHGDVFSIQQMTKPEQLTLLQEQPRKLVSTEQLIKQFESILSKSHFQHTSGNQKLFIKLNPEHLGALRIEIIQKESLLIAKMMTTTQAAKELLESEIQSLKHAFNSQNIQLEKIEISQQMSEQERFLNRDAQQQQEQRQQREKDEQNQQHTPQVGMSFEEVLLNVEV